MLLKKVSKGKIEIVTGMYFLLLLLIISMMQLQMSFFAIAGAFMEDALAASLLACAVIDIEEYGMSHTIQIADPYAAYALYQEALIVNMGLNNEWEPQNLHMAGGAVEIWQYTIYNVVRNDVVIYSFDENGRYSSWKETNGLGQVKTPDGTIVETTSVYSRIRLPVQGALGLRVYADKDKTVDITSNLNEEGIG